MQLNFTSNRMSGSREGPNLLRPYYIPPSVGPVPGSGTNSSTTHNFRGQDTSSSSTARASFGSSARDILSDLDYTDYLTDASPSAAEVVKGVVDQALWRYTSVLLGQPFEVAKTVLQVQVAGSTNATARGAFHDDMRRRPGKYRTEPYDVLSIRALHCIWLTRLPDSIGRLRSRRSVLFHLYCPKRGNSISLASTPRASKRKASILHLSLL